MQLKFPLSDVKIEITQIKKEVDKPLYDDGFYKLNQNEFSMDVEGVGSFYASGGLHALGVCFFIRGPISMCTSVPISNR